MRRELTRHISENKDFPTELHVAAQPEVGALQMSYTIDEGMQDFIQKILEQYKPDRAALVAMDARTGKILSMASFAKNKPAMSHMALRSIFPAASIAKMVTATAAFESRRLDPDSLISFQGANHTLYRKNVFAQNENRWTRSMTIREAFAKSVNTVFGKLGLFYVGGHRLQDYFEKFYFNKSVPGDLTSEPSHAQLRLNDEWEIVQRASGFNRDTTLSPLQGALMASSVVMNGRVMSPWIIDAVHDSKGALLYQGTKSELPPLMSQETSSKLKSLMEATVDHGTGRKSFRKVSSKATLRELTMGGKTGSIMSREPEAPGKIDWFVGFAEGDSFQVALAVVTVSEVRWTVKSSALAAMYFNEYRKRRSRWLTLNE